MNIHGIIQFDKKHIKHKKAFDYILEQIIDIYPNLNNNDLLDTAKIINMWGHWNFDIEYIEGRNEDYFTINSIKFNKLLQSLSNLNQYIDGPTRLKIHTDKKEYNFLHYYKNNYINKIPTLFNIDDIINNLEIWIVKNPMDIIEGRLNLIFNPIEDIINKSHKLCKENNVDFKPYIQKYLLNLI